MQPTFKALLTSSLISMLLVSVTAAPPDCLAQSTFEYLVDCLNDYTVPKNFYADDAAYNAAQPTVAQALAWSTAVTNLMSVGVDSYTCDTAIATITSSNELWGIYNFAKFSDSVTANEYCILIESTSTDGGVYTKGWGFLAVSITHNAGNGVHLSAPHPTDPNTSQQAGALFKGVGARSLLIAGRSRLAYKVATTCVLPSSQGVTYYKTDPVYDDMQPFFSANVALYNAQLTQGGCPSTTCGFVQLHGKGANTCASDNMFLSAGLGNSSTSGPWYLDSVSRPVKRLQANLNAPLAFPGWTISLPPDSSCRLTAATNIVGRFLNGVPLESVCSTEATASTATGYFVHVEQDAAARSADVYTFWETALKATFGL